MMQNNRSLRTKLTLVTVCILVVMCLVLTATVFFAIGIFTSALSAAVQTMPAEKIDNTISGTIAPVEAATRTVKQAKNTFTVITACVALVVVISGTLAISFYIKKQLSPLEILSREVGAMDAESLSAPLRADMGSKEINGLLAAFNDMRQRVDAAYTMQKNFSGNAAHELRTPLAAMQSKLEVFRMKKELNRQDYDQIIDILEKNAERLSLLVNELLELSNLSSVNLNQKVNLRGIADEAAMDLETFANQNGIEISVTGDANLTGNDCLLQRAVFNLMQNAVRYNVPGGKVVVAMANEKESVTFSVTDTGLGIPKEMKSQVFEPFFRVDKSRSRAMGGSGLGLAIVKRIVEQHHGSISVEDNVGQGTIITLIFPA